MEDYEAIIFGIISHAGEARGLAFDALNAAEEGDFDKANKLLEESEKEFLEAHKIQTDIIHKEAAGEHIEVRVMFVHAQDHLMTALTEKNLVERMIKMYKRIQKLEGEK